MKHPNIVLLGGGTGSFTLLQGLKKLTPNITAIVNMSDDGGSTGTLRDELGVLPPGDIRQCLVALSDNPEVRNLFSYRFSDGRFEGQSLGNIILSGLELQHGGMEEAIRVASELLHISGRVVPVTLHKHTLVARDGTRTYKGEHIIDGEIELSKHTTLHLEPEAHLNPEARAAILAADLVVLAPGSVHSSLLPILVVTGVDDALKETKAKVVYVANLVNKPLQTDGWHVADYVEQFERYTGRGAIDFVLYNTETLEPELLQKYVSEGELPVPVGAKEFIGMNAVPIGAALVSHTPEGSAGGSAPHRTLIRHDAEAVCAELEKLLKTT